MYIHIGGEYQIPTRTILTILDIEQQKMLEAESINQIFLQNAEQNGLVEFVEMEVPRSFIITVERVYLSPISAATLRKRLMEESRKTRRKNGKKRI